MFETIEWNARFGWRPMTETERWAHYWFWRGVGEQMDLTVIPPCYEEARQFKADYEARHFRRTRASVELVEMLFTLVESWLPRPLRPAVRPIMSTLIDEPLFSYFDLKAPSRLTRRFVHIAIRLGGRVAAKLRARRTGRFYMDGPVRSYPEGYALTDLGPPEDWHDADRTSRRKRVRATKAKDPRYCHHGSEPAIEFGDSPKS